MKMKKEVLWIEDDATYNLQYVASPVYMSTDLDLTMASTVSEAIHQINRRPFDAIVFDLRIPPGNHPSWMQIKNHLNRAGKPPRLGLHLLLNLYGCPADDQTRVMMPQLNGRPNISRIGVLSVDPLDDVQDKLGRIQFKRENYRQKRAGMSSRTLLDLLDHLVA